MDVDYVDLLTGIFLLIGAVGIGTFVVTEYPKVQEREQTYDQTMGTIVESTVVESDIDDDGTSEYRAVVRYEYTVDETYQNTRVYLEEDPATYARRSAAEDVVDEYDVGETVTVSYAVQSPEQAFLSHNGTTYVGLGLSGFMTLILMITGINTIRFGLRGEERPQLGLQRDDEDSQ